MEKFLEQYQGDTSSVIQALQDTQRAYGYISRAHLKEISACVGVPYSYTYAIATFYKSFSLKERGKYIIKVCDGTACHLKLSEDILDEIHQDLGISIGETTPDQLFSLEQVNCLGACAMAPVISINDELHGKLTRKKVRTLLHTLREENGSSPPSPSQPSENQPAPSSKSLPAEAVHTVKKTMNKLGEIIDYVLEGR